MGRQLGFCMTFEDERRFIEFARSDRNVRMFTRRQNTLNIEFLEELPLPEDVTAGQLFLWDEDNSPFPTWCYVPKGGFYFVDTGQSEVIEFDRCAIDEKGRWIPGRIWAEFSMLDGDRLVKKGQVFEKWFDRLARWIRKHGVRDEGLEYVLPGAQEQIANQRKC